MSSLRSGPDPLAGGKRVCSRPCRTGDTDHAQTDSHIWKQVAPLRVIYKHGVTVGQFLTCCCVCASLCCACAWRRRTPCAPMSTRGSVGEDERERNVRSALTRFTPRPDSHRIPFSHAFSIQARHWDSPLAIDPCHRAPHLSQI